MIVKPVRGPVKPNLNKVGIVTGNSQPGYRASFYDFIWDGSNHVYAARELVGVEAINITTPSSPSRSDASFGHTTAGANDAKAVRACAKLGNTLVTCQRGGSVGRIETWDISTPGTLGSNVGVTTDVYEGASQLYSDLVTDGSYVYVSGQVSGFFIFDVSTITNIVLTGSLTSGTWETQGLDVSGNYAYCCNYTYGLRIVDITTKATPTSLKVIPPYITNGVTLRPWKCVADGNYLYVSTNTSGTEDDPERGLLVMDISSPTTIPETVAAWTGYGAIPPEDQGTWNSGGDKPMGGINKYGDYVFATNGLEGIVVWNVSDPSRPIYMGKLGNHSSSDSIIDVAVFEKGGKIYAVYGDGTHHADNEAAGSDQFYIDEIIF